VDSVDPPAERHPSLDDRLDPALRIVDHDERWAALAGEELGRLRVALGAVAVRLEHVGSTAVPGLAAKPILDLQLSVPAIEERAAYVGPLERLGYLFAPDPDWPDYHFFGKPRARPRSIHLHVCQAGSAHEFRHIAVRDYLRAHAGERAAYGALKRRLIAVDAQNRLAYIAGKERFVDELEARAIAWVRGTP
jgi:GrpB-like predicted nucleotidyltransferase (UPF0157 family)